MEEVLRNQGIPVLLGLFLLEGGHLTRIRFFVVSITIDQLDHI